MSGSGISWAICKSAAIDRYLLPAGPTAANLQQRVCWCGPTLRQIDWRTEGQTDRWMDTIPFHRPHSAYYMGSILRHHSDIWQPQNWKNRNNNFQLMINSYSARVQLQQSPRYKLTETHNRLTAVCPGLPGYSSTRRNTHPLMPILVIGHPLSVSSIYYDPWHLLCSVYVLDSSLWQPVSRSSLVFLLVLSTSYSMHFFTQSSSSLRSTCPYQRSLFCCNTNALLSIPSLSLSSLLGNLSFSLMPHIHLTI